MERRHRSGGSFDWIKLKVTFNGRRYVGAFPPTKVEMITLYSFSSGQVQVIFETQDGKVERRVNYDRLINSLNDDIAMNVLLYTLR